VGLLLGIAGFMFLYAEDFSYRSGDPRVCVTATSARRSTTRGRVKLLRPPGTRRQRQPGRRGREAGTGERREDSL